VPEKIFLTYTNATALPYQGTVLGHHIVLNYIDSNGKHHTLQGVPEHGFDHNLDKLIAFLPWPRHTSIRSSSLVRTVSRLLPFLPRRRVS
jgi:hypothetical protein